MSKLRATKKKILLVWMGYNEEFEGTILDMEGR